jgi:hypothetical protein
MIIYGGIHFLYRASLILAIEFIFKSIIRQYLQAVLKKVFT